MRKTVSPTVSIAVIVAVLVLAGYLFYNKFKTRRTQFIPGQGIVDPRTGRVRGPSGERGRRAARGGTEQEQERGGRRR